MKYNINISALCLSIMFLVSINVYTAEGYADDERPRILVTTDGEIDDECSMVRFLLYANEFDIEGIVTSSSVYHWKGGKKYGKAHNWPGDDWLEPYMKAYAEVYPNLVKHDPLYPSPEYLRQRSFLGNIAYKGEMDEVTPGSEHIVNVLLDKSDIRPIWIQAWGGPNTLARALKTIEEKHPDRMAEVAAKMRFFFIWEQDDTYQKYILPKWGKYSIMTIISDQFEAIAYRWKKAQPHNLQHFFEASWMKNNILENHGPLCKLYKSHRSGEFRSEGDSPAFMHQIPVGLRNLNNPDWGGWGGRYVRVRSNTWLDPAPYEGFKHPEGKWHDANGWGINALRNKIKSTAEQREKYFKPIWRWSSAFQNDFAARADWCVKTYEEANHAPIVRMKGPLDISARPGKRIKLNASKSKDPDGDNLRFCWWQYKEAGSYGGNVKINDNSSPVVSLIVPADAKSGESIHIICEVADEGTPSMTRYQRIIINIK